jgi:hypothetical protein
LLLRDSFLFARLTGAPRTVAFLAARFGFGCFDFVPVDAASTPRN